MFFIFCFFSRGPRYRANQDYWPRIDDALRAHLVPGPLVPPARAASVPRMAMGPVPEASVLVFREEDWLAELLLAECAAFGVPCRFARSAINDPHAIEAELRFVKPTHLLVPAIFNMASTDAAARRDLQLTNLAGLLTLADIASYEREEKGNKRKMNKFCMEPQ